MQNQRNTQKPVPFKNLGLLNRFFFDAVAEDDETCRAICEIILGQNLPPFIHTQSEKEFRKSPVFRSIRVDIFSKCETLEVRNDTANGATEDVFSAEMQGRNTGNLPRRSRYYQAHLDVSLLEPGEIDFNKLSSSYLIFICPFDLFGEKRYRYTFRMRADENTDLLLQDGMTRIFLNTRGTNDDEVPAELVEFLHYIEISDRADPPKTDSARIQKVYDQVKKVRENETLEVEYMQAWEELAYARQDGREEGFSQGITQGKTQGMERGKAITLIDLVASAMKRLKGTVAEACDFLEIPEADYLAAKRLLDEQPSAAVGANGSVEPAHSQIPVTGV